MEALNWLPKLGEEVIIQGVTYFQATPRGGTQMHIHLSRLHIVAFEKGGGTVVVNGVAYRIQPGDLFITYPGERHQFLPDGKRPYVAVFWHLLWYGKMPAELPRYLNLPKAERPSFFRLCRRAVKTWNAPESTETQLELYSLFLQMLADIWRIARATENKAQGLGFAGVDKTLNIVLNELHGPPFLYPGIDCLAEKAGVSRRFLTQLFRSRIGCGIKQYFLQNMMRYATRMLATGEERLCDIARQCGYSSTQNFLHARRTYLARQVREPASDNAGAPLQAEPLSPRNNSLITVYPPRKL
ncbi:MAG: helix-turn-helix domain-containing protein [Victivallales bacterium]|nr:helix-turn-helix domain-containing protein [Victivallales bacterium]